MVGPFFTATTNCINSSKPRLLARWFTASRRRWLPFWFGASSRRRSLVVSLHSSLLTDLSSRKWNILLIFRPLNYFTLVVGFDCVDRSQMKQSQNVQHVAVILGLLIAGITVGTVVIFSLRH
ncbi:hypothetical protein RIF29_38758 [Crotalaria pallida]|uniref:Uncharacterized protein n=1 Tax=Crotalaria pallida TaxID=3830 RepID=A0AAN9HP26_CROPI